MFRWLINLFKRKKPVLEDIPPSPPKELTTSEKGIKLIKDYESDYTSPKKHMPHLEAYICPSGQWTIGFGNTFYEDKSPVKKGDVITQERANELLINTLKIYEAQVKHLVKIPLEQHEFDALVSFFFNSVYSQLVGSNTIRVLNDGEKQKFLEYHSQWVHDFKKNRLPGLVRRRAEEAKMFRGEA
jgi:lysozyme